MVLTPFEPEGGFIRRTYKSERMIEGAQGHEEASPGGMNTENSIKLCRTNR